MTSLPPEVPYRLHDYSHIVSAYNTCLRLEESLQRAIDAGEDVGRKSIYIRILGYLIHYLPTDRGLKPIEAVVEDISSAADDSALFDAGRIYFNHYLHKAVRRGLTPTPSAEDSPFDTNTDMFNGIVVTAPRSHADAKKNALIRDGYRCVVTRKYELDALRNIKEVAEKAMSDGPRLLAEVTRCAHIFPMSTDELVQLSSTKPNSATTLWSIMARFGYGELVSELCGTGVHRLQNVMTVAIGFQILFDELQLWFVKTGEGDTYKIEAVDDFTQFAFSETGYVTFTTPDPVNLPVPSPKYLALHAACAKVAYLSGATECIEKYYQDMEARVILDPSGGSAEMLEHAIFKLQTSGYEVIDSSPE